MTLFAFFAALVLGAMSLLFLNRGHGGMGALFGFAALAAAFFFVINLTAST